MQLTIYQVDAFTNQLFGGNPAAVVPLEKWIDDDPLAVQKHARRSAQPPDRSHGPVAARQRRIPATRHASSVAVAHSDQFAKCLRVRGPARGSRGDERTAKTVVGIDLSARELPHAENGQDRLRNNSRQVVVHSANQRLIAERSTTLDPVTMKEFLDGYLGVTRPSCRHPPLPPVRGWSVR